MAKAMQAMSATHDQRRDEILTSLYNTHFTEMRGMPISFIMRQKGVLPEMIQLYLDELHSEGYILIDVDKEDFGRSTITIKPKGMHFIENGGFEGLRRRQWWASAYAIVKTILIAANAVFVGVVAFLTFRVSDKTNKLEVGIERKQAQIDSLIKLIPNKPDTTAGQKVAPVAPLSTPHISGKKGTPNSLTGS